MYILRVALEEVTEHSVICSNTHEIITRLVCFGGFNQISNKPLLPDLMGGDIYKTWTGIHGPPHAPGPIGPTLIFKSKSSLLIWKFTRGQGMKNTDSNWRNLKTPAFRFRVDEKHFENGVFGSDDNLKTMWFLCLKFPQTQIQKWQVIGAF